MKLEGKRILVVGGAGLIGSHVVDQLVREDVSEIVVFDNFVRGTQENLRTAREDSRVRVFDPVGDITQIDVLGRAVAEADAVIHLAALWLLQCHEYPRAAFDVNIAGTFNILEACVTHGIEKLVYSSSASVYGDAVSVPMTEDHPFNNRTFYGATKVAGEQMCRAFHERYDLDYVGLRYMNVYGPRQDYRGAYIAVIMKMLDRIDQGLSPIIHGDGSQTYDFIHVEDIAHANICALKSDATDSFYNVGRGIGTSLKELAGLILELTGCGLEIQYEPQTQSFVTHRIGCPKKAANEIGFEASIGLEEGLKSLIEWREAHKAQEVAA